MCQANNFHEDLMLDVRYKTVFAVAAGMMPGERMVLLTGEQKIALGFIVETGDEELDEVDPVPMDDWFFAWLDQRPEDGPIWYVFEGATEDEGPGIVGYKFMDSCQCWRPRVIFGMVEGGVDECEWIWAAGDHPLPTPESVGAEAERMLRDAMLPEPGSAAAVEEAVEPTADVNDR